MSAALSRTLTLDQLRAQLQSPRVQPGRLPCGHDALDAWLGGWPLPGVVELVGAPGSGRLAPILPVLERLSRALRPVVVVDPLQQFHPPGVPGIDLRALLLVRPAPEQAVWAAEQVARSGAVEVVLLLDSPLLSRGAGLRLVRAAEAGHNTTFVVGRETEPDLPASIRLVSEGWAGPALQLRCTRGVARDGLRSIPFGAQVVGFRARG